MRPPMAYLKSHQKLHRPRVLTPPQVEALRRVVSYARDELGIDRKKMAEVAHVDRGDLDNFISRRRPSEPGQLGEFKTQTPRNAFALRMLQYAVSEPLIRDAVATRRSAKLCEDAECLAAALPSVAALADTDFLFHHLASLGVIDATRCKVISKRLSGRYYVLRMSSSKRKIVKSYLQVHEVSPYYLVPYFENMLKEQDGALRYTQGNVVDMNGNYICFGFVEGDVVGNFAGIKVIVVKHGGYEQSNSIFDALYMSVDNDGSYDVGKARIISTTDVFDANKIGFFDPEELNVAMTDFALRIKNSSDEGESRAEWDAGMILSSINIALSLARV